MRRAKNLVDGSCLPSLSATEATRRWHQMVDAVGIHPVGAACSAHDPAFPGCSTPSAQPRFSPYNWARAHSVPVNPTSADSSGAAQTAAAPFALHAASAATGLRAQPFGLLSTRGFAASALGGRQGGGGGPAAAAEVLEPAEAARRVLEDPMSRLMASQGMPVGLSLGSARRAGRPGSTGAAAHDSDEEDLSGPPRAEPGYQMEALSDMLRATAAAARGGGDRGGGADGGGAAGARSGSGASSSGSGGRSSGGGSGSGKEGSEGFVAGVQRVGPSLNDSWGTTRESPADIARRIAESNLDVERGAGGDAEDGEGDDDDPLALSPSEEKYASLEAMSRDIKRLDEVFELLASVPWLDEDVLSEKELKGVAQVGLLGTLEEVGFNIRDQLLRIWSGERGAELAAGPGLEFRDQAALMAILYHTQQIEDAHGPPPRGYLSKPLQQGQGQGQGQ